MLHHLYDHVVHDGDLSRDVPRKPVPFQPLHGAGHASRNSDVRITAYLMGEGEPYVTRHPPVMRPWVLWIDPYLAYVKAIHPVSVYLDQSVPLVNLQLPCGSRVAELYSVQLIRPVDEPFGILLGKMLQHRKPWHLLCAAPAYVSGGYPLPANKTGFLSACLAYHLLISSFQWQ